MKDRKILTRLFASRGRVDRRLRLAIDATHQEIRISGRKGTAPPLLIVQAGPGLSLLNEVPRFRRLPDLEADFTVCYWDQRGCGRAASQDLEGLSVQTQVDDLCHMVSLLHEVSGRTVHVVGISMGATYSLMAAQVVAPSIASLTAISPDIDVAAGDLAVAKVLEQAVARSGNRALARRLKALGPPPYRYAGQFQERAKILTDFGFIEYGRRFSDRILGLLSSLLRTYGLGGALRAISHLSRIQDILIPRTNDINLIADLEHLQVPVHFVFGEHDAFLSERVVGYLKMLTLSGPYQLTILPKAAHFPQFDAPQDVGRIIRAMAKR